MDTINKIIKNDFLKGIMDYILNNIWILGIALILIIVIILIIIFGKKKPKNVNDAFGDDHGNVGDSIANFEEVPAVNYQNVSNEENVNMENNSIENNTNEENIPVIVDTLEEVELPVINEEVPKEETFAIPEAPVIPEMPLISEEPASLETPVTPVSPEINAFDLPMVNENIDKLEPEEKEDISLEVKTLEETLELPKMANEVINENIDLKKTCTNCHEENPYYYKVCSKCGCLLD